MTKSITNLRTQDSDFATENIFTARIGIFDEDFPAREDQQAFFRDLGVFGAVVGVIILVGLCASFMPAHRATRVEPVEVLK